MRNKPWNGEGVWSSHPCPSPSQMIRQHFGEITAMLKWDERLRKALIRAEAEYIASGSPAIPCDARNYRKTFRAALAGQQEGEP